MPGSRLKGLVLRLISGGLRNDGDYTHRMRIFMLNSSLLVGILVLLFYTPYNAAIGLRTLSVLEAVLLLFLLLMLTLLHLRGAMITASIGLLATVALVAIGLLFAGPGIPGTLNWLTLYPLFAFFLLGKRGGLLMVGVFMLLLIATWLGAELALFSPPLSNRSFVELINSLFACSAIIYFYEKVRDSYAQTVTEQNQVLNARIAEESRQRRVIEELSITDPLTGLYNRRHFDTLFELEIHRAQRDNSYIGLVMIDVDLFKNYNDNCGHQEGDKALIEIAAVMKSTFRRATESVFRLGGEEFAVVVAGTPPEEVAAQADRLRRNVEALGLEHPASDVAHYVTISVGVVTCPGELQIDADSLYRASDKALYRAKTEGRNRVVLSDYP